MFNTLKRVLAVAVTATLALGAVACSEKSDGPSGSDKKITIGYMAWDEAIAVSHLWQHILEEKGYQVQLKNLEAGLVYGGLASGDIDFFLDGWLPQTHASYLEKYGDKLEKLGVWYEGASLSIAVPAYVEGVESLADLAGKADTFGGEIIGIEPGAGLTKATQEKVLPGYGLDGAMKLKTSSTPAMLAALDGAITDRKPIVVTLWHPHWAYAKYELKDLADPKGTLGAAEQINTFGRKDFGKDFPEVTKMLQQFKMDSQQLASLEDLMFNTHKGDEKKAVEEWLKANPDYLKALA
ncbi:glycine betaine/proline transport system substrate-binding protein [Micromonospora citrea]|uniref:Glycine betaine/proline transport system substrate-binding protein n=1 Tax=Micromonospora citrea TaxID=47855 RepID=A0A1C6TRT3_9ACTN|nr:glycine betaine ABC transporter substrate-binding protein [Micromonospora citrea]SCL44516.1 glycine betaine/proline transport system substrate-binding protein [Micromonospora citrea]